MVNGKIIDKGGRTRARARARASKINVQRAISGVKGHHAVIRSRMLIPDWCLATGQRSQL